MSALLSVLPRKSKSLSSNLAKSIFGIDDPLLLVATVHLYFDHILHLACGHFRLSQRMRDATFATRLGEFERSGKLPHKLASSLRALNALRNAFAHELFYDLADWNPRTFAFIDQAYRREPRHRSARRRKHLLLFRVAALELTVELHRNWRWLHLIDLPGALHGRVRSAVAGESQ
jgi:hypothetical protein